MQISRKVEPSKSTPSVRTVKERDVVPVVQSSKVLPPRHKSLKVELQKSVQVVGGEPTKTVSRVGRKFQNNPVSQKGKERYILSNIFCFA